METKLKLEQALKTAMKAGDDVTKRTVRMALAAIRQVEIDKQVSLEEPAVLAILQKEIKTRHESVEEASRVNRTDIVAATQAEIKILEQYLPAALTEEELKALVLTAISEVKGGQSTFSTPGMVCKAGTSSETRWRVLATVLNIFQFPATNGFLMVPSSKKNLLDYSLEIQTRQPITGLYDRHIPY